MLIKELLFPRRCPVCDNVCPFGTNICPECRSMLVKIRGPVCYKCGKALKNSDEEYCFDCKMKKHNYDRGVSLYEYNSICDSIYRLKYKNRSEYAEYFGTEMANEFCNYLSEWKVDGIISVPLHKKRFRKRGYNQADILAKALSKKSNVPYFPNLILRNRNTIPLKQLDPSGRQINLKNAFIIRADDVKLNRVVIVDDIYTTGSTIDEMSCVLKESGVQKVYFMTLASGVGL